MKPTRRDEILKSFRPRLLPGVLLFTAACTGAYAQQPAGSVARTYTWQQVRERFEATNPTLHAGQLSIDESKAHEVTAYLRPNPDFSVAFDQFAPFTTNP